jgi:hypothetical protein
MKMLMTILSIVFLSLGIAGCAKDAGPNGSPVFSYNSNLDSAAAYGAGDSFGPSYTNMGNGSGF